MWTEPVRQIVAVIIDHGQSSQLRQVEWKSDRDLLNAVVANVKYFKTGKFRTTEFSHLSQFVDVQMQLFKSWHIFADGGHFRQVVPIQA